MKFITDWLEDRFVERSTYDGIVLVGVGLGILLFKGLLPILAYTAILFGAWTIIREE